MKTVAILLTSVVLGVAATQAPSSTTSPSSPAPAAASASSSGSAPAAAQSQGTGTIVHPISKNINDRLTKSTRHMDKVEIKQGDREVETLVYYPMEKNKAMAVVLVHEIFGVSDWMRAAADQLAEAGYIVLVPDLLSGMGPNKGGTNDIPESQITSSVSGLDRKAPGQVMADLGAVVAYAKKLDACNGNVAVAGFCWGGGQAFAFTTVNKDIKAAFVFYGAPMLPVANIPKVNVPVYGFYGEVDRSLAQAVPAETTAMQAAGKTYDAVVYAGAHHGFMRMGQMDNTSLEDKKAAKDSWKRWLELLKKVDTSAPAEAKPAASGTAK